MKKVLYSLILLLLMVNFVYAADIGNINKAQVDANNAIYFNGGALSYLTDSETVYPHGGTYYYDTGTAGHKIKGASGTLLRVVVGTAGTASNLVIYDYGTNDSCAGTVIGTVDTTSISSVSFGLSFTSGLCIISTQSTTTKITIVYE